MKKRVLLADQDVPSRDEIAGNLVRWGYEVVVAKDGQDAWKIIQRSDAPRIALLSAEMSDVGGLELCRRVRDLHGDNSFLFVLTASDVKAERIDALEAGADGVIEKPIHLRELRMRLAAGLRGRRLVAVSEAPLSSAPLSVSDPSAESLVGRIVARKYQIERLIGKGGMGTVWQGTHLSLATNVAIKFIKGEYARHAVARARFELEARAAARLRTKYAVKVFDYGVTSGGMPYLVMEYLEGPSLLQRVQQKGAMPFADTVTFVAQAAQALGEAHSLGIIHRDVKPDNVLMVADPDANTGGSCIAKLIDFGVVKLLAGEGPDTMKRETALSTQVGLVVGTPNFMAPEQLRGEAEPDMAGDLWALAACAFTAVTGKIPFEGSTLSEVLRKVCDAPLPIPSQVNPHVPPEFDVWFAKACSRNPAKRFHSARELAASLASAYADFADASLDMTPSLTTFVAQPAISSSSTFPCRRLFELDEPMLATTG